MKRWIQTAACLALAAFALLSFASNKADVDLWGNVGFVRAWPTSSDFLRYNTFSFTEPEHAWINHEWLSQWIFNHIHRAAGNTGLVAYKLVAGFLLLGLVGIAIRRSCPERSVRFFFLLLWVSTVGYGFGFRPHLHTYLLLGIFLYLLRFHAAQRWVQVLLVALGFLWVNLHGAFFIGIVLVVLFAIGQAVDRARPAVAPPPNGTSVSPGRSLSSPSIFLAVAAGLLLVSLANPYGADLWTFLFRSAAKPRPYLTEWSPFNLRLHGLDHPDFIVMAVLSLLAFLAAPKPRETTWWLILGVAFLSACLLRRNIPLFAIVAAFVVPAPLAAAVGPGLDRIRQRIPPALLVAALALFAAVSLAWAEKRHGLSRANIVVSRKSYPVDLVQTMKRQGLRANVLVFFDWAEYCEWHLYPSCRVFLDGRFNDAYDDGTIDDYFAFLYGEPGGERALTAYPTDAVLLHVATPAFFRMMNEPGWSLVARDGVAALFLKRTAHGAALNPESWLLPTPPESEDATFP